MAGFRSIWKEDLWKITSLNSLSLGIKFVTGFVTSKILAVYIGPAGMGLVGNLRNFLTSVENIATLGFTNGIVKYTASYQDKPERQHQFISTVLTFLPITALLSSLVIGLFASYWNQLLFEGNPNYQSVFFSFALALPWYLASVVLTSILNGLEAYKKVVYTQIFGAVAGLLLSVFLVVTTQTYGALVAVVAAPAIAFLGLVFYLKNQLKGVRFQLHWPDLKNLSHYSLMAIASAVIGPFVLILLRNELIAGYGWKAAGYWEALNRISSYYFLFLSTLIGLYFLPRLAKVTSVAEEKSILKSYYLQLMPVFALGLLGLYFFRVGVVRLFLSEEFEPVSELLIWQLVGDFGKGLAMILGYRFFAYRQTKLFILTELVSLTSLYFLAHQAIASEGVVGLMKAYALNYGFYFLLLILLYRFSKPVHR
ncbi:MAG: hypothetical protein RLZZ500_1289 [Bacteroidota bacterium]|jgi:PST family polysaccharide transporter